MITAGRRGLPVGPIQCRLHFLSGQARPIGALGYETISCNGGYRTRDHHRG